MGLMSLAGHRPKSGSRHVCLIIAKTGQRGPVLYKVDNDAAGTPEGGPALRPQVCLCWTKPAGIPTGQPIFVSTSHQTGLDSRLMTRRSIIVEI